MRESPPITSISSEDFKKENTEETQPPPSGLFWRMGSGMVNLTKGAVGGTVGLGVGAVKLVASTSYGVVSKCLGQEHYRLSLTVIPQHFGFLQTADALIDLRDIRLCNWTAEVGVNATKAVAGKGYDVMSGGVSVVSGGVSSVTSRLPSVPLPSMSSKKDKTE